MSHCVEFWHKWKKEPNFCGLSPQSVSEIKGYLELVEKIKLTGVEENVIFEQCTSGAARPLIRLADNGTRTEATNYIVQCLKRGEKITQGDLQSTINGFLGKETPACKVPKTTQLRRVEQEPLPMENPDPVVKESLAAGVPEAPIAQTLKERYNPTAPDAQPVAATPPKEGPFKTALQAKGGIAGQMFPAAKEPAPLPTQPAAAPENARQAERERRNQLADELLAAMPGSLHVQVRDIQREHQGWTVADCFYFGIQTLHERKGRV